MKFTSNDTVARSLDVKASLLFLLNRFTQVYFLYVREFSSGWPRLPQGVVIYGGVHYSHNDLIQPFQYLDCTRLPSESQVEQWGCPSGTGSVASEQIRVNYL